ncbi:UNVERIFIED_CONTAM: hypothetical protein RMT77_011727 [Armadillidium vulgare]
MGSIASRPIGSSLPSSQGIGSSLPSSQGIGSSLPSSTQRVGLGFHVDTEYFASRATVSHETTTPSFSFQVIPKIPSGKNNTTARTLTNTPECDEDNEEEDNPPVNSNNVVEKNFK